MWTGGQTREGFGAPGGRPTGGRRCPGGGSWVGWGGWLEAGEGGRETAGMTVDAPPGLQSNRFEKAWKYKDLA